MGFDGRRLGDRFGFPLSAFRFWLLGRSGFGVLGFDRQQRLADLDGLPLGDVDFGDLARVRAGEFNHGLFGFQLDDGIIGGDHLALAHQDANHVGAGDIFAKFGELEFDFHGLRCQSDRDLPGRGGLATRQGEEYLRRSHKSSIANNTYPPKGIATTRYSVPPFQ